MNNTIICPIESWGMGTSVHEDGETGYGFPETTNPTNFHPDIEVCTKEEIANHARALKLWVNEHEK